MQVFGPCFYATFIVVQISGIISHDPISLISWVEDDSSVDGGSTNWGEGAPSGSENRNCMYMDSFDGYWGDAPCRSLNCAVCSKRITTNNTRA